MWAVNAGVSYPRRILRYRHIQGGVMTERTSNHSHELSFDTYHEYQVWKQARSRDIATGLLACFSLFGVAVFVAMIVWAILLIAG